MVIFYSPRWSSFTRQSPAQGIPHILHKIREAERLNPNLGLAGFLLTMVQRRLSVHAAVEAQLRNLYGDLVFTNAMFQRADIKEATLLKQPVGCYKPHSAAAGEVKHVADELLGRLATAQPVSSLSERSQTK